MILIKSTDVKTTLWSGGTTTQLAISPEGAVYADRDFDWRLSTAEVNDEKSTFTPLPDYHRFLTIRKGSLRLKHDEGDWYTIGEGDVAEFEGGSLTESEGVVTDYNLMVRKGKVSGSLDTEFLDDSETLFMSAVKKGEVNAIYLSRGGMISVFCDGKKAAELSEGDLLIFDEDDFAVDVFATAEGDTYIIRADISRI